MPRLTRGLLWFMGAFYVVAGANRFALHDVPVFGATRGLGVWNWVRLPFQSVLMAWAWWYTRPAAGA